MQDTKVVAVLFLCGVALAQVPAFEVASIKPSGPPIQGTPFIAGMFGGPGTRDPELVVAQNYSLLNFLEEGYDVHGKDQIVGPDWLKTVKFDVTAKAPRGATREQFRLMIQNLLAERFGLKAHMDTKEVPGWELVVAKSGARLNSAASDAATGALLASSAAPDDMPLVPRALPGAVLGLAADGFPIIPPGGMARAMGGRNRENWSHKSMDQFASEIWFDAGRPVKNATGLQGEYDFSLYWYRECSNCTDGKGEIDSLPSSPDFGSALKQQLGLALVPSKSQIDVLVIDHIERTPTEN
jgi:uncharacterized protein (TIGR03435 family)